MTAIVLGFAALLFLFRVRLLHRVWRLPLKNGEKFFLAASVGPDFYRTAGIQLFRRYHISLSILLVLDAPLAAWLVLSRRYIALPLEQLLAMVASIILYNLIVFHYSAQAGEVSGCQDERPVTLQLSMEPRRMRDYTVPVLEAVIVMATLASLGMLIRGYELASASGAGAETGRAFRGGVLLTVWVLYWQLGFLLLKVVFVRWRMPLPSNRTEDFRRWRAVWLSHNLKIFDAVRVLCAAGLLAGTTWVAYGRSWSQTIQIMAFAALFLGLLVYAIYVLREGRRLAVAEREMKPVELVKEFPRRTVAEGRYLAGGLLYFNRDNPRALVRSGHGIALNLARPSIYAGAAYFSGLVALVIWMARLLR